MKDKLKELILDPDVAVETKRKMLDILVDSKDESKPYPVYPVIYPYYKPWWEVIPYYGYTYTTNMPNVQGSTSNTKASDTLTATDNISSSLLGRGDAGLSSSKYARPTPLTGLRVGSSDLTYETGLNIGCAGITYGPR